MNKGKIEDQEVKNQEEPKEELKENKKIKENKENKPGEETDDVNEVEVESSSKDVKEEVEKLKRDLAEFKEKYLRLYSEFENFRRRTAKEKLELIQTANEELMISLLPVIDDFRRARQSFEDESDSKSTNEGFIHIEKKLEKVLEQNGLKPMKIKEGDEFDSDLHEAVTQIPAPKKKLKGKIVDVIEEGYYLGEKVIRFAKVVIGS